MAIKLKSSDTEETQIYGNENFGIPKDCTKKQRFSSLKLAFYIVAVMAICVTGYKYYNDAVDYLLPEITYDRTKQPLIYSTTSGVVLKNQNGKSFDVGNIAQYSELSQVIRSASMGKSVFFITPNLKTQKNDLCYYSVANDSIITIDADVTDFKINADGKYVLYRKGTSLYFSDLETTNLIADSVSEYYLSKNNQAITFFTFDGDDMYICSTAKGKKPQLVDQNITKIVSPKDDHTNVVYIKDSQLFSKEYGEETRMLSENVADAIALGSSIYYTAPESYQRKLDAFFIDDSFYDDEKRTLPDGVDFIKEIDGLNFFDEEAFQKANEEYEQKLVRDEIREYFSDSPLSSDGYSLYCYKDEDATLIDTDLVFGKLSLNSNKNIMVYKKYDTLSDERQNLSTITTADEAIDIAQKLITVPFDVDMHLIKEGKEPFFAFEDCTDKQIEISLDGKYLYCIENSSDNASFILNRYEIGTSSLKNKTLIKNDVTDFAIDGSDSTAALVFNGNNLSFYYENKLTELSENSCRDFFFVDGTLFFYDDYNHLTKSGTLRSIRNGKISTIDTNVFSFKVRKYNNVSYIKNYNPDLLTGTLYIKDGKTVLRQDNFVGAIIN